MSTSQDFALCEPHNGEKIDIATLAYMRARNRNRLFTLVLEEFERSNLSQADLARRLGKKPEVVCRWLAAPGNWQLDTFSDLLFAISGAEAAYAIEHPLKSPARNSNHPMWLGPVPVLGTTPISGRMPDSSPSDTGSNTKRFEFAPA